MTARPVSGRAFRWLAPFLLIGAAAAAYVNSLSDAFVLDDYVAIHENPYIEHLWPIWRAAWAPPDNPVEARPVASLTLALNYAISGRQSTVSYHVLNIAIHVLAGLTLFGVVRRTLHTAALRDRFGRAAEWLALAVALLWLVHPLQTECVTYIIVRTESLMGLFFLLTLYCTIRGATSPRPRGWYVAAVAACLLGMGSKEVMAVAPPLVFLYDRTFLAGSFRRAWRMRWRLHVGLAATWLVLAALVAARPRSGSVGFGFEHLSALDYARTQCGVVLYYLRLALWPHPLSLCYDDWPPARAWLAALPYVLIVLALLAATAWALWRAPALGFLGAWFFVILAPTSSFLPIATEFVAERRMYLPLIPVLVLIVLGVWAGLRWLGRQLPALARARAAILLALLVLATTAGAAATLRRNLDYRSEQTIWEDTLRKRPDSAWARVWLATLLRREGRTLDALPLLEQAVELAPKMALAQCNMADALSELGRPAEAAVYYARAVRLNPDDFKIRVNYGRALIALDRKGDALVQIQRALSLKPDDALAHFYFAQLCEAAGKAARAIAEYTACLRSDPGHAPARANLGMLLLQQGRTSEAAAQLSAALRLAPGLAQPHVGLAYLRMQEGNLPQALEFAQNAARLAPDWADAPYCLGLVQQQQGRLREAVDAYRRACALKPDFTTPANNLAWILATAADASLRKPDEAVTLAQRVVELSGGQDPVYLDTLAAAYAAAGRFDDAVQTVTKALDLARTAGQDKLAQSLADHLTRYQRGEAYVEGVKP
jgi:tetratricopeptide (TPR) repeat protein